MVWFTNVVKLILLFLSEIACVPIIKTSGVQWSEPIGTGKGNITILMIPQTNACNNDSDMVVAVKSDYQILSQDTQLLNLVVNENADNKSDVRSNICMHNNTRQFKDLNNSEEFAKNNNNIARYFEPEKKLSIQSFNGSTNPAPLKTGKTGEYSNSPKSSNNNGIINMFKFLNVSNLNQVEVFPSSNKYQINKAESGNVAFNENNMTKIQERAQMQNNHIKEKSHDNHNLTFFITKNDSTARNVIDILRQVNQDASLSLKTKVNKEEDRSSENRNIESKVNPLISNVAEDVLVEKDDKHLDERGLNLAQVEGNMQSGTTCWPFFISFSNEQPTGETESVPPILHEENSFQKAESKIEVQNLSRIDNSKVENCTDKSRETNENQGFENIVQMLSTSSSFESVIGGSPGSSVRVRELVTSQETTQNTLITSNTLDSFSSTVKLVTENSSLKYANFETTNPRESNVKLMNTPQTECKTQNLDNLREMTVKLEQESTSVSVGQANALLQKKITLEPSINCETQTMVGGGSSKTQDFEITTKNVLEGNQIVQTKVTMELPINCETKVGLNIEDETTISSRYLLLTNSFQEGNRPVPTKITLEPPVDCATAMTKTNDNSLLKNCLKNGQIPSGNLTIPFVESSVVLANNNEMSKGKDISITLNSSLDEFPWSDIQDGGDKSNGKMCGQFHSNSMSLGSEHEYPQGPSQLSLIVSKNSMSSDKNRLNHQQNQNIAVNNSKNKIVKENCNNNYQIQTENTKFKSKNNITEWQDSNNQKTNVKIMSPTNYTDSNAMPSQVKSLQRPIEETEAIMQSVLKSSTLFYDEEILTIFDKTTAAPIMQVSENYYTPQGYINKESTSKTFPVSSSQCFAKESRKSDFLLFGNDSDIQLKGLSTTAEVNNVFQTYEPSYDNAKIDLTPNSKLPSKTMKTMPCKRKKVKYSSSQGIKGNNIELHGDVVQEIVIKFVKNTNGPEIKKKKTENKVN